MGAIYHSLSTFQATRFTNICHRLIYLADGNKS